MAPILEKAYANALLFSVGLLLGGSTESPSRYAQAAPTAAAPEGTSRAQVEQRTATRGRGRRSAESEELALLRRAESDLFGDGDALAGDSVREPAVRDAPLSCVSGSGRGGREGVVAEQMSLDSSEFWADLRMPGIPVRQDPRVEKYIRYFTQSKDGRAMFSTWLRRSGKYREVVFDSLRENGLPESLIAVVFIESGFGPTAVSTAGATGLWQLMPRTARAYGLTVDRRYDERRSIWKSTEAATKHLADLYGYFRSWELALAAYNYGHQRLAEVSDEMATNDFWALSRIDGALPRETALYVPKILAVAVILNNLERFGLDSVKLEEPVDATPMEVPPGARLSLIARASGTSLERLRALNPEYRRDVVPELSGPAFLHVPSAGLARARVMLPRLLDDAERDTKDMDVPASFDWGRDDLGDGAQQRLAATVGLHARGSAARTDGTDTSASYFRRTIPGDSSSRLANAEDASSTESDGESSLERSAATATTSSASETKDETPAAGAGAKKGKAGSPPRPRSRVERTQGATTSRPHASKAKAANSVVFYIASERDTTASVARTFGVSRDVVLSSNQLEEGDELDPGQLLRIPVATRALQGLERRARGGSDKSGPSRKAR